MIYKSERRKSNQRKNLVKKKKKLLGQREGRIEILCTLTNSIREKQERKKKEREKEERKKQTAEYCHIVVRVTKNRF